MELWNSLRKLYPFRVLRSGRNESLSIILLQPGPRLLTIGQLQAAAERAWGVSFAFEEEKQTNFVVQVGEVVLMKAGPHILNFLHCPKPYFDNPRTDTQWLTEEYQRQAWTEHEAWTAVDYMNKTNEYDLAYGVLAKLAA